MKTTSVNTWKITALTFFSLFLGACSSDNITQTSDSFYCTVSSASIVNSSQLSLTLSASGGSPNYTISSVTVSGYTGTLVSGSSSFSSYSYPTVQVTSLSSLSGASGVVTIYDTDNLSASCSFSVGTTITGSSSLACTMTPSSSSLSVGSSTSFSMTGSGGTAPYSFYSFSPGTYGSVTSALTSTGSYTASAAASYSSAVTASPSVYVSDAAGNTATCSTYVYVSTSSSSTSPTCYLSSSVSGSTATLTAVSSDGSTVYFTSLNPGTDGSITSYGNPATLSYSSTGTKTVTAVAYTNSGYACNSGSSMTTTLTISSGSTSSGTLSCNAIISPNPSYRGQYVNAYAQITGYGTGSVRVSSLNYQTSSGMTGYFTSATNAMLYFPYAGYWPITLIIQDSAGNTSSCSAYQTVY